jgi:hypothetical protein
MACLRKCSDLGAPWSPLSPVASPRGLVRAARALQLSKRGAGLNLKHCSTVECSGGVGHPRLDRSATHGTGGRTQAASHEGAAARTGKRGARARRPASPMRPGRRYDLGAGHPLLGRPISTSSPRAAHGGCSPCCTRPDRYCAISVSPVPSTSLPGRIGNDTRYAGGAPGARQGRVNGSRHLSHFDGLGRAAVLRPRHLCRCRPGTR